MNKRLFEIVFERPNLQENSFQQRMLINEKTSEKTTQKIIEIISKNRYVSAKEISEEIEKSTRAIEMQISKLKEKGILKRIGPDKGGHWEINEEKNEL